MYLHCLYMHCLFMSYTSHWLMFLVTKTTINKVYLILSFAMDKQCHSNQKSSLVKVVLLQLKKIIYIDKTRLKPILAFCPTHLIITLRNIDLILVQLVCRVLAPADTLHNNVATAC